MNDKLPEIIAKATGMCLGETIVAFASLFQTIRLQPGFDDQKFKEGILRLIEHPNSTELQKAIFNEVIAGSK
jgi:hypothetical protein